MQPWFGRETADITYHDGNGELTSLLIDKGYLDSEVWAGISDVPYFIEVKTTTGRYHTPFYMSKSQYQRVSLAPFPPRL